MILSILFFLFLVNDACAADLIQQYVRQSPESYRPETIKIKEEQGRFQILIHEEKTQLKQNNKIKKVKWSQSELNLIQRDLNNYLSEKKSGTQVRTDFLDLKIINKNSIVLQQGKTQKVFPLLLFLFPLFIGLLHKGILYNLARRKKENTEKMHLKILAMSKEKRRMYCLGLSNEELQELLNRLKRRESRVL